MGEKRKLDACCRAAGLIALIITLASCSLPRLIVLNDPLTPEEHLNLGVTYEKQGESDAALREYTTASGKLPIAYLYIGNVHFQLKEMDQAERAYRRALEKTDDPRAYNNLACLYYSEGRQLDEAEALARKAVALSPESPDFKDTLDRIKEKRLKSR